MSVSVVCCWCLEQPPTFVSYLKDFTRRLLQDKKGFRSLEVMVDNLAGELVLLHKLTRELQNQFFFRKNLVPAAKRPGADFLKISVPEIVGIVSDRISRHLQRELEDRLWKNSWVVVAGRRLKAESFPQDLQYKSIRREDAFRKHFSLIMSNKFRYQLVGEVSANLGGKVPVVDDVLLSYEQKFHPTTQFDEFCIEIEIQADQNYYVVLRQTYLGLELKFVKWCGYESNNTKALEKEHKAEAKADEETVAEEEQEAPVFLITHVSNLLHSIYFNVEA